MKSDVIYVRFLLVISDPEKKRDCSRFVSFPVLIIQQIIKEFCHRAADFLKKIED